MSVEAEKISSKAIKLKKKNRKKEALASRKCGRERKRAVLCSKGLLAQNNIAVNGNTMDAYLSSLEEQAIFMAG